VKRRLAVSAALLLALVALTLGPSSARVATSNEGRWPETWPEELEPLRDRALTVGVATGLQMNIHQIPFEDPDEFEALWPVILGLKSKGGTLTLYSIGAIEESGWPSIDNSVPTVRILAPPGGLSRVRQPGAPPNEPEPLREETREELEELIEAGKALASRAPWPESAYLPNGELAEWVTDEQVDGRKTWVPADRDGDGPGFLFRAHVDIELVVDNYVIDLSCMHLPDNTRIIDKRGLPAPEEE